eukprot:scaffold3929_cov291-Pinguiococcus_pyrenoidosus.AAC.13
MEGLGGHPAVLLHLLQELRRAVALVEVLADGVDVLLDVGDGGAGRGLEDAVHAVAHAPGPAGELVGEVRLPDIVEGPPAVRAGVSGGRDDGLPGDTEGVEHARDPADEDVRQAHAVADGRRRGEDPRRQQPRLGLEVLVQVEDAHAQKLHPLRLGRPEVHRGREPRAAVAQRRAVGEAGDERLGHGEVDLRDGQLERLGVHARVPAGDEAEQVAHAVGLDGDEGPALLDGRQRVRDEHEPRAVHGPRRPAQPLPLRLLPLPVVLHLPPLHAVQGVRLPQVLQRPRRVVLARLARLAVGAEPQQLSRPSVYRLDAVEERVGRLFVVPGHVLAADAGQGLAAEPQLLVLHDGRRVLGPGRGEHKAWESPAGALQVVHVVAALFLQQRQLLVGLLRRVRAGRRLLQLSHRHAHGRRREFQQVVERWSAGGRAMGW